LINYLLSNSLYATVLAFIVVLGITITIHEFGHFAMAKLLKIRVMVFSIGFGPKIAGFTKGGTEYRLSPIPLGGYVKMAGETFDEERKGTPDEFLSHPKWHRLLVALAGPFMNIMLAVGIFSYSYYMHGEDVPKYWKEPTILGPVPADSPARRAGLQTGDQVLSVHGNPTKTWKDLEFALGTVPRYALNLQVLRDKQVLQFHVNPPPGEDVIDPTSLGLKFSLSKTLVYAVDDRSPAKKAGLKEGDEILSVTRDGKVARNYSEILNLISESKGIPLDFKVRRPDVEPQRGKIWESSDFQNGRILHFRITPVEDHGRVVVGFVPDYPSDWKQYGVGGAIAKSIRRNFEISSLTFRVIGRILKGTASPRTLSGPIEIARISGSFAEAALRARSAGIFFGFLGLVSLQLGVFNLLPIPILDGGVIALLLVEGLIRRDLSLNLKEKIVQVGFVFLILLMGFVIFNDLSKIDFSKIVDVNRLFR
jgi:regulator of sigma E protease